MPTTKPAEAATKYETLAEALIAFQSDIPVPTREGQSHHGKYATLDNIVKVLYPKLTAVGISYTAAPDVREDGIFGLRAKLVHESGEEFGGFYPLGNPNNPAQTIGSAITYARRYALLALTGVAPADEDDDGSAATDAQASTLAKEKAATTPARETAGSIRTEMGELIDHEGSKVTSQDANAIMEEVAPGKEIAQWTLADLRKGRDKLKALITERGGELKDAN